MLYTYTARNNEGNLIKGKREASDKAALAQLLQKEGLLLTSTQSKEDASFSQKTQSFIKKLERIGTVPLKEKLFFAQNLRIMLHSGISLSQGIDILIRQTKNKRFKYIVEDIQQMVEKGTSFADSLKRHPKIFNDLFINIIRAGEASGQLENTLRQLELQMKKDYDLIHKVKGALTYPIVVIVAMVGVMIATVTFVIPKISLLFEDVNASLPLPTKILIAVSNFMVHYGWALFIATIFAIFFFIRFIRTERGKKIWHKILLKLPIIGPIIKKINLARFSRTLSSLLKTDIPIVESFRITAKTVGNYYYQSTLKRAAHDLKKGSSITSTLEGQEKLFPPLIHQMIMVGEESGSLDEILENLAIFYEDDVDQTMENFSSVIEPLLILLLGVGVGAIAISVIMPIYSLTQQI